MRTAHAAMSAVLVFLLLALAGCDGAQQSEETETAQPTPSPDTPATGTTPEPTEDPADQPTPDPTTTATGTETNGSDDGDVAVAVDADGRVVVLDATSGDEIRELLDGVPVDDPASNDIAVTPDGEDVLVVVPPDEPSGPSEILRIPVDGGEPERLAEGTVPAVDPSGETLAYVAYEEGDDPVGTPEPVLVLRDLDSGEERRLEREEPFFFIPDVEWTADGDQVVLTAGEIHTGLYAIDREATTLDDARRLGPDLEQGDGEASWGPIAALGDGQLAVVERCCGVPSEERWHVMAVDTSDGTTGDDLLPGERAEATHLDSDAAATRLLLVAGGGPDGGQLERWDGQGDTEQLADGVIVAAW